MLSIIFPQNSNTTNVKVKRVVLRLFFYAVNNSNTTNVKVKLKYLHFSGSLCRHSNTTNVKVKQPIT